jgi:hypothetical protein
MLRTTTPIILALIAFAISSCRKTPTTSGSGSLLATWKKPHMSYTLGVTFKSDNTFIFGIYSGSSYTETIVPLHIPAYILPIHPALWRLALASNLFTTM